MKSHPLRFKILLAMLSVVIALTAAEVGLRVMYGKKDTVCVFPPHLHYTFQPDSTLIYGVSGKKNFDTDKLGIRKFDSSDPDEYTILFIGGSTTECLYLDNKETWPYLLAQKGKMKGGSIGKSGQTSVDHYMQMKYFVPQLKNVKTIVIMCGLNDMIKALAEKGQIIKLNQHIEDSLYQVSFTHTNRYGGIRGLKIIELFKTSYRNLKADTTGQALQDIYGYCYQQWRKKRGNATHILDSLPISDFVEFKTALNIPNPLTEYEHEFLLNIKSIISMAQARSIKLIFVSQCYAWRDTMTDMERSRLWMGGVGKYQVEEGHPYYSTKVLANEMQRYNAIVKGVCEGSHITFIDLPSYPTGNGNLYDDCHFSQQGANAVADSIYRQLF